MHRLRLGLAGAGFCVALLSVALDNRQLGWGAIALLCGSLILRLLAGKRERRNTGGQGPV
jgi:hypothetical protein